ncbi:MAG: CPBP family intramembrane metalloprotease [candidate division WOR-3 bacterium]|nr:MAG: CPBP family intramembrane metalloprotease [candidate division WOR-3 bacterium]
MNDTRMKAMGLGESILLFGIPAAVFYLITRVLIPYFNRTYAIHPVLVWFVFGGLFLFVPLFVLSIFLFKRDNYDLNLKTFVARFRLTRLTKADWVWCLGGLIVTMVLTGTIMGVWRLLSYHLGINPLNTSAPFLHFDPLQGIDRLLLLVWVPFFFFNIVGEELLWRGYILPRQELAFGKYAWLINAIFWAVFHLCFGLDLMILLLPALFVLPYVVQRRKNTHIGVIIHALVNGPSFILISLGLVK